MDYLGIGDNKTHRSPEQMSIASQGKAMKALLNKIKRSNLIIYGHSFGTTVATVVASSYRNEKKNANPTIRGVVLEGIVGPGLGNVYGPEFLLTASKTWGLLSDTEKISFQSTYDNLIKNLLPHQKDSLNRTLTGLLFKGPKGAADSLKEFTNFPDLYTPSAKVPEANEALRDAYRQIKAAGCEAIEKADDLSSQKIFGSKVTPILNLPKGLCDCRTLKSRWNPNDYKIANLPVVYINGDADPATPIGSAKKHFEGQDLVSEKIFLAIPGGGHAEAAYPHGKISSCFPFIFESLTSGSVAPLKRNQEKLQSTSCTTPFQPENGIRNDNNINR